jgi:hypothetical protein
MKLPQEYVAKKTEKIKKFRSLQFYTAFQLAQQYLYGYESDYYD